MFKIKLKKIGYRPPWILPLETRINSLKKGKYKIAYYYPQPDGSTFRYRVYNVVKSLNSSSSEISAAYFHENELERLPEVIDIADLLVFCRTVYTDRICELITIAKNKNKIVIYDIDDLVFDTKYTHLILKTMGSDLSHPDVWANWFGDIARYGAVLELCDRAITTNLYLADKINHQTGKPVSVIPNYLNSEQLEISNDIYQQKLDNSFLSEGPIYVGYFSGSPTHDVDFSIVSDALIYLFEKYKNLKLRIVGQLNLENNLSKYSDRIEVYPFQDFINLQTIMGEVEIGLIPLQDNEFTNCKSELKYFEAGIVGTVSIASPTYIYNEVIEDGQNGFLAKSYEWSDKIEYLLNNMGEYRHIAENAHEHSEQNYSCHNMVGLIEKVLLPDKLEG